MVKVFFVHPMWQKGGVETTNTRWASILADKNVRSIALTHSPKVDVISNMEKQICKSLAHIFFWLMHKAKRDDIILLCQSYYLIKIFPFLVVLKIRGCRIVLTERNSFDQYGDYPIKRWIYGKAYPHLFRVFDAIIVNSEDMAREFVFNYTKDKTTVFKNPRFSEADLKKLKKHKPVSCGSKVYTFCRWSTQKDPEFMIAADKVFSNHRIEFNVYCGRNEYSFQKPFAKSAFYFMMEDPNILLFCSKFEGFPNLLLEARVAGLPIIFSRCNTGVEELLHDYDLAFEFVKGSDESLLSAYKNAVRASTGAICKPDIISAEKHSVAAANTDDFLVALLGHGVV